MTTVKIFEWTRGHITVGIGDRRLTIQGEGHLNVPGSPGFLILAGSIRAWDPPHENDPLDVAQKKEILEALLRELDAGGHHYTVEGEVS
ncbi:Imm74 family immunity protein [Pendulispora albinea]|uniref:Immunity 74 family protein n=1 Tax=Pendulispora albinea TaxID=2741071 RepID=A0ABZ2LYU9_9BACT